MVGDVNLFFNDHDDPYSAEIEIMIAGMYGWRSFKNDMWLRSGAFEQTKDVHFFLKKKNRI